jgi:hypothetical protein
MQHALRIRKAATVLPIVGLVVVVLGVGCKVTTGPGSTPPERASQVETLRSNPIKDGEDVKAWISLAQQLAAERDRSLLGRLASPMHGSLSLEIAQVPDDILDNLAKLLSHCTEPVRDEETRYFYLVCSHDDQTMPVQVFFEEGKFKGVSF